MLLKQNNRQTVQGIILTGLLTLLASCGNSSALESLVSADPKLKGGNSEQESNQINPTTPKLSQNSSPSQNQDFISENPQSEEKPAESQEINSKEINTITSENKNIGNNNPSKQPVLQDKTFSISQDIESLETTQPLETETKLSNQKSDSANRGQPQKIPEKSPPELTERESISASGVDNNFFDSSDVDFADLDEVPEQLKQPLKSVAALGILTPYTGKANVELTKFAPNEVITRGEYARWLIAANNRYYSDDPGKKIYVAAKTNQPAFKDVKANHPDFEAIQSLAESGLIPSRLTEDSTNLLFRPDAPLIREDLVTWKVPLDTRKSLPKASIEAIEESWGFQDAADIDSSAVRALYADYQNGDRSNIRRILGYTMIFQPKKAVTRAEAAASLWYFGFQGDGITAKEVLESETETDS